jgi:hypothetical protein
MVLAISVYWISFHFLKVDEEIRYTNNKLIMLLGFILLLSAIFPYAVVNKTSVDFLSYGQRHNMLVPFGFSLILFGFFNKIKSQLLRRVFIAIFISSALFAKVFISAQYYHAHKTQENFILEYKSGNYPDSESTLFIISQIPATDYLNWRLYEFGSMMRLNGMAENKVFLFQNSKLLDKEARDFKDIDDFNSVYVSNSFYGISMFNTGNYDVKFIEINASTSVSLPQYFKSLLFRTAPYHKVEIIETSN